MSVTSYTNKDNPVESVISMTNVTTDWVYLVKKEGQTGKITFINETDAQAIIEEKGLST